MLLVLAWPAQAESASVSGDWLELADQGLWLRVPQGWRQSQRAQRGLISLELEDPRSRSGVMLWGGELGMRLEWRQLADLWRKNSADLANLAELQEHSQLEELHQASSLPIRFQESWGSVGGVATRTWVGYLPLETRSFVLMGIVADGDAQAAEQVRQILVSLRDRPPEPEALTDPESESVSEPLSEPSVLTEPLEQALLEPWPEEAPEKLAPEASVPETAEPETSEPAGLNLQAEAEPELAPESAPPPESIPPPVEPAPAMPQAFSSLQLSLDEAGKQPVAGELSRDIKQLICHAQVEQLHPGAQVRAEWYYLDGGGDGEPFVRDQQVYVEGQEQMSFSLFRPDNTLFPRGSYRLLLLTGDQVASIDFQLRDPSEAELLEQARQGQVEGQFGLYAYLRMGQLEQVTEAEAVEWLLKAAHQGMAIAQYQLGLVYFEGLHGVAEDRVQAMDWFRRAALQDNADAAYYMAKGYRDGLGVPKNLTETLAWTERAARLGHPQSAYNLGLHYFLGEGVAKDRLTALKWLNQALASGYEPAREVVIHLRDGKDSLD
ncbi:MAG: SEL1-like repeat protein [Gammaproteobacteria bacterium]|nr:SEL1-like repeat protein [Gammaproteobacteria bacterium]